LAKDEQLLLRHPPCPSGLPLESSRCCRDAPGSMGRQMRVLPTLCLLALTVGVRGRKSSLFATSRQPHSATATGAVGKVPLPLVLTSPHHVFARLLVHMMTFRNAPYANFFVALREQCLRCFAVL
jgi:hypothetical protein